MNRHQWALALFAVVLAVVITMAFVTTLERVNLRQASTTNVRGTTRLAQPHPQLDRALGEPIGTPHQTR